jgi:amidase
LSSKNTDEGGRLGYAAGPEVSTMRRLVAVAAAITAFLPSVPAGAGSVGLELEEATVAELQEAMSAGRATSRTLVEGYLARIARLDPALRSVLEVNPDALDVADRLDRERKDGVTRGPLHGIPVIVKDNVATGDSMETTAGSLALSGNRAPRDAFLVARLREAGAVILAKANLSEWANMRSSQSSSGWSGRGGQTRNPYALDRTPCGSSSGTAVAVAASLAAVGVGTETDGSIVCPSAATALVGLKPTVGLVSRTGIAPVSRTQDTAGPMTRTVADAAVLLAALAAPDPADPATRAAREHGRPDYRRFLDPDGLRGARIGVARRKVYGNSPPADRIFDAAVEEMRRRGAVIVDPADIPHLGEYDDAEMEVLLHELKAGIDAWLPEWAPGARVKTLADVIAFDEARRGEEMPFFGQDLLVKAQEKGPLTSPAYRKALDTCRRLSRTQGLDAIFARHRLDAIVAPTGGPPWTIDLVNGDHFVAGSSTPAAVAGYPSITVPAGQAFGLPVGVSFIGKAWDEGKLIRLAYAYEQATRKRRPPRFLPTADLSGR